MSTTVALSWVDTEVGEEGGMAAAPVDAPQAQGVVWHMAIMLSEVSEVGRKWYEDL